MTETKRNASIGPYRDPKRNLQTDVDYRQRKELTPKKKKRKKKINRRFSINVSRH